MTTDKAVRLIGLKPNRDLAYLNERFEAGQLVPVIDGRIDSARRATPFGISAPGITRARSSSPSTDDRATPLNQRGHLSRIALRRIDASQYSPARRGGMSRTRRWCWRSRWSGGRHSLGGRLTSSAPSAAAPRRLRRPALSAVPDAIVPRTSLGRDEVVEGWPQDLSTLPGHEQWTYGGARGVLPRAESRLSARRRRLPKIARPQTRPFPRSVERAVSASWIAVAQREHGVTQGAGGSGQDPRRNGDLARGVSANRELGSTRGGSTRWWLSTREGGSRGLDAVGQVFQASARGVHQSVRRGEKCVGCRRLQRGCLQVQPMMGSNSPDDRHAENAGADETHFNRPTF